MGCVLLIRKEYILIMFLYVWHILRPQLEMNEAKNELACAPETLIPRLLNRCYAHRHTVPGY